MSISILTQKFEFLFGNCPTLYTAPGRINLIGEHTDYNGGFVFPGAIDKGIYVAIRPNNGMRARIFSLDFNDSVEFNIQRDELPQPLWARYIYGVCAEIGKRGYLVGGFDAVFAGDIPLGAGLSSSAALESAFAFALNDLFQLHIAPMELARIGQATEHNYCGVKCGIMDQFASIFGKRDHLIRLNCATMEYEYFPIQLDGYVLVLLDTMVKHELASSAYNDRRAACERVLHAIQSQHPEYQTLSDVPAALLDNTVLCTGTPDSPTDTDLRRARYVVEERQRVLDVCEALRQGDLETVGKRMYETHEGLSRNYEVSCEELDFLVSIARQCGVTGTRMMGGGFGGCTINLVKGELLTSFLHTASEQFIARFGHQPGIYQVRISDGTRKIVHI